MACVSAETDVYAIRDIPTMSNQPCAFQYRHYY